MSVLNRVSSSMVQHGTKHLDTILSSLSRQALDVTAFGAQGNGNADDTSAVQAAIDAAAAAGGGIVHLPAGIYRITAALTMTASNIVLRGEGAASVLKAGAASINIVEIGDGTANPNNSVVDSLRFTAESVMDVGTHAIIVRNGHNITVRNVRLDGYGTLYNGIRLVGGAQQYIYNVENFEINEMVNHGIVVDAPLTSPTQNVFLSNGEIGGGNNGILLLNASGVYMSMVECLGCHQHGLATYPAAEATVRYLLLTQCVFDSCTQAGVFLSSNGGTLYDVQMNGCWSASNGRSGIEIGANTVLLSGCKITNNGQNGVLVTDPCRNLALNGNQIVANNMSDGQYHGVYLSPDVQNFVIQGNQIGLGSHYTFNRQKYGVFVAGTTNNHYIVRNNLVTGNIQGGVYDGGLAMEKSVGDNID